MALPNVSLEELRRRNEQSKQARAAEKASGATASQQKTGR